MSKTSHPYFIANDPDRKTTAILLTGTASEKGIDQHDIQMTSGGFNVTKAIAEAIYGEGFDDEDETEDETEDEGEQVTTGQVPVPGEPIVTGSPKDGTATTAVPVEDEQVEDDEEPDQTVAPEHQDHDESAYAEWSYADLKAEINRRQIETPDNKGATYIAALIQADADAEADETEVEGEQPETADDIDPDAL